MEFFEQQHRPSFARIYPKTGRQAVAEHKYRFHLQRISWTGPANLAAQQREQHRYSNSPLLRSFLHSTFLRSLDSDILGHR
jgi:hypothetical protein